MPNWCEGYLKVRGELGDILTFLRDGFEGSYSDSMITIDDEWEDEIEIKVIGTNYIKGTSRACIDSSEDYICPEGKTHVTLTLNIRQAWDINSSEFCDIAKKFNLDMHIIGYERGMEFKHEFYIIDGAVTEDKTTHYKDWDFECECSELGG